MTDSISTYMPLNLSAPDAMWAAFGAHINAGVVTLSNAVGYRDREAVLAMAYAEHRDDGIRVLGAALAHLHRLQEERARTAAITGEANALADLARALRECSDSALLQAVSVRLEQRAAGRVGH